VVVTCKVTSDVSFEVTGSGFSEIETNNSGAGLTINVAESLMTLLNELVTTQRKVEPFAYKVVAGVVYIVLVAPDMLTPFFCH